MGVPSILSLFLLCHLLFLHHSSGKCPDSFNCGTHGQLSFPLSNETFPQCGLYTVQNCEDPFPKLNLGAVELYFNSMNLQENSINVSDPRLENLDGTKICDIFLSSDLQESLPNTSSISLTKSPVLTLFKCDNPDPRLEWEPDVIFQGFDRYGGCNGFTVYYNYSHHYQDQDYRKITPYCSVIELPVVSELGNRNASDLLSVLTSEFSVRFNVSKECSDCRQGRTCTPSTDSRCKNEKKGRNHLGLILGIAVSSAGIMVILLVYIIFKKLAQSESKFFWKKKTGNYQNIEAFLKSCGSLSPKRYSYSDIKKITKSFKTKLGQGGFGSVFKGELENGCFVAVKVLKGLKGNGDEFVNEVATISRTSHVNIVTLLGFCFEGCHKALIYEFMPNGSLDKFISDGASLTYRQLGWEALYQIAVGIARGLEYLHRGCNTRILHFDIKPHNILLNDNFCPKISDFGLAKLCPQKESIISLVGVRGTTGYIAPELFSRHFGGVSHKSDVYSYGMMILEMVGARKNTSVEVDRSSELYFPHWIYKRLELDEELGLHGVMESYTNGSARKMIIVGLWCIQTNPSHRPAMSRVVEMLEGTAESLQIPPKPFLSSPARAPVDSSTTQVMTL